MIDFFITNTFVNDNNDEIIVKDVMLSDLNDEDSEDYGSVEYEEVLITLNNVMKIWRADKLAYYIKKNNFVPKLFEDAVQIYSLTQEQQNDLIGKWFKTNTTKSLYTPVFMEEEKFLLGLIHITHYKDNSFMVMLTSELGGLEECYLFEHNEKTRPAIIRLINQIDKFKVIGKDIMYKITIKFGGVKI